jgi:hypothetical protein
VTRQLKRNAGGHTGQFRRSAGCGSARPPCARKRRARARARRVGWDAGRRRGS